MGLARLFRIVDKSLQGFPAWPGGSGRTPTIETIRTPPPMGLCCCGGNQQEIFEFKRFDRTPDRGNHEAEYVFELRR